MTPFGWPASTAAGKHPGRWWGGLFAASAKIVRAELPVHRNKTSNVVGI
jgi:hypothetical protein